MDKKKNKDTLEHSYILVTNLKGNKMKENGKETFKQTEDNLPGVGFSVFDNSKVNWRNAVDK